MSGQVYSIATGKLPFPPLALTEAVKFLRACLTHSSKVTEEQVLTGQTLPSIASFLAQVMETGEDHIIPGEYRTSTYNEHVLRFIS